jgi:hypothetical protein
VRLGAVILHAPATGITADSHVVLWDINFFAMLAKAQAKLQPQLTGVTLSVRDSPEIVGSTHYG